MPIKNKIKFNSRAAFTIVELLVMIVLVSIVMTAVYRLFSSSYFFVKTSEEKLQNVHAVSILMEGLRYELSSLPDFSKFNDQEKFIADRGKWISNFSYDKVIWDEANQQNNKDVTIKYEFNGKEIKKTIGSAGRETVQVFGRGRIKDFGIMHNFDPENPKFPVYFLIKIQTVDEKFSEVKVQYTVYPRLLNKNLQLIEKVF